MLRFVAGMIFAGVVPVLPLSAEPLSGQKQIFLQDAAGEKLLIGNANFTTGDTGISYSLDLVDAPFTEHFLSMRPFRCLEGPAKHWCYVPYPYDLRRQVSADDLTDLEYDLLFIHKGATEYGIDMWNGVYYRLEVDQDRLIGRLYEMDMGLLAVPPEAGDQRPLSDSDIHEADPESHWLPVLVIE